MKEVRLYRFLLSVLASITYSKVIHYCHRFRVYFCAHFRSFQSFHPLHFYISLSATTNIIFLNTCICITMSKRSQQDQCSVCRKSCNGDDLFCRSCGDLFHSRCEQITAIDFRYFQRASVDYICVQCRPRGMLARVRLTVCSAVIRD